MKKGDVKVVRGKVYRVTRIRPDGEPCLTRVRLNLVRVPGGGFLGQ